ncbi:MAG: hypothetical protein AMXMBFR84_28820 [Candidatus Hydrogenedentota bacterium]
MTQPITAEQALRNLRQPRVLHPVLLALSPLFGLYAQNAEYLPLHVLIRPAVTLTLGALLLWIACSLIIRDHFKGGLFASTLILGLVVLWGPLEDIIEWVVPVLATWPPVFFYVAYGLFMITATAYIIVRIRTRGDDNLKGLRLLFILTLAGFLVAALLFSPLFGRRAAWLITGYLILLAMASVTVWRYQGDRLRATRMANWFGTVLLALYMVVVVYNLPRSDARDLDPFAIPVSDQQDKPDVYCIMVDGYPRGDVLRSTYGYNNLTFEQFLTEKGFQIADRSRTNYTSNLVSLAAFLNGDYLQNLVPDESRPTAGMETVLRLYRQNRVAEFFDRLGYTSYAFSPGLESIEPYKGADVILKPPHALGEFELVLLNRTFVSRLMQGVFYFLYRNPAYWRFEFRRERILYWANQMGKVAAEEGEPKIVFTHLLVPDPPFLFTRDGHRAQPFGRGSLAIDREFRASPEEYVAAYREQLHFTNQLLQKAIDSVLDASKSPPIILIVSGQGSRFVRGVTGAESIPKDIFSNFVAVHLPRHDTPLTPLPADITLVNVFPFVLNAVFDADVDVQEDVCYSVAESSPLQAEPLPQ